MAAVTTVKNDSGMCWINDASDEDQQVVFVPGISRERSLRTAFKPGSGSTGSERKLRMRAPCGSESRSESSASKSSKKRGQLPNLSLVERPKGTGVIQSTLPPPTGVRSPLATPLAITETSQAKSKASLKDLCSEDKRRISNLIQELARVSEEKDESVQRRKDEQESFERKIQQLERFVELIVQERGSLQQQYRECQELLGLHQQYLSLQQEKLNQSIAQLTDARSHNKVASGEESSTRPATRGASGPAREPIGEAGLFSGSASLSDHYHSAAPPSPDSSSSSGQRELTPAAQGPVKRRGGRSEPRPAPHHHHHHRREPLTNGYSAAPQRTDSAPLPAREKPGGNTDRHGAGSPGTGTDPEAARALTAPQLGPEDWEEKRHRLLLQKMQLEVERERLQARLAQQEERLVRQNQQLRRSRREYSRFQQATAAELGHAVSRDGIDPGHDPLPDGPSAPSVSRNGAEPSGGADRLACEAAPRLDASTPLPLPNGVYDHESPVASRRDMATSPVVSQSCRKAGPVPAIPFAAPRTPQAGLDSSLMELLEVFSPISVPERGRSTCPKRGKPSLLQPPHRVARPARHALLSPPHGQDLEESQILEEIFFIC